jgi:hypothetical protein
VRQVHVCGYRPKSTRFLQSAAFAGDVLLIDSQRAACCQALTALTALAALILMRQVLIAELLAAISN